MSPYREPSPPEEVPVEIEAPKKSAIVNAAEWALVVVILILWAPIAVAYRLLTGRGLDF